MRGKYNAGTENDSLRNKLWKGGGGAKSVVPIRVTQRKRKKCQAVARQCRVRPSLHVPPTSTPTENAVLGDEKEKQKPTSLRKQLKSQCHPMLKFLSQDTDRTVHGHYRQAEDRDNRKSKGCGSPLMATSSQSPERELCVPNLF